MMTIDIISYTEDQFAALSTDQVYEVQKAQRSKDSLSRKLEQNKKAVKYDLVKNGNFRSAIYEKICAELTAEYEAAVESIREGLLFYLHYGDQVSSNTNPYPLDYSLSATERTVVVRDYYLSTYSNAGVRLETYAADRVAKQYLGEMYAQLYEYFLSLT